MAKGGGSVQAPVRRNRRRPLADAPTRPVSRRLLLGGLAAALATALVLIAASLVSGRAEKPASGSVVGGTETSRLLDGIPQQGNALGSPDAPVTLVEYADLQCPYCAEWATRTFPSIVDEYVRAGRLRIVFRGLAFVGPESEVALRATLAAGLQGRLWHVLDLAYRNQGAENSGWVDERFLRGIGAAVPGLDAELMLKQRSLPIVTARLEAAQQRAAAANVTGTPTFEIGPTGGALERLELGSLDAESFREALAARL